MPLQNRVNPEGEICRSPERGSLMGNRGCLHDERQSIVSRSKRDAWVTCLLDFKGRRRALMQLGQYTELFFLDEATALAAGHRPCAECRRERYKAFLAAWPSASPKAGDVDAVLKRERLNENRVLANRLELLPDGALVKDLQTGLFYLVLDGAVSEWSFAGYAGKKSIKGMTGSFRVLTPASTVEALRNGYRPDIHRSAFT